ncbi:PREDICTED: transcription factor TGA2.2 isoform X2 [Tarenaya hassleriana]|uniref:transcription factor TGA2.2 isoform X2 n=1 Tax=Tarenaya hassleriana TaxID=28532 RepID=UPI00053C7A3C|nr:PREDICTED: transcription factor TGA2.2 isoform X2 [Tarenaya hassleriana]
MQGHHPHHHQLSASTSSSHGNFMNKDDGSYELGDMDPTSLFLYLDAQGHQDPSSTAPDHRHHNLAMRPPTSTLNIFPSQPMHVEPPASSSAKSESRLVLAEPRCSNRPSEPTMQLTNPANAPPFQPEPSKSIKKEVNLKGHAPSHQERPKTPDTKTLRRLAQNREAARKSRLRKKAYVQQLESCRIKLTQLEQEIQRARAQGVFFGGTLTGGDQQGLHIGPGNISSAEAAVFDMEYGRWLEEQQRLLSELRAAVEEQLPENELRMFVDNVLGHYDQIVNLKAMVAKSDVFHLVSGAWKSPAERCFMWLGGFRPSEIIKVVVNRIEPLTEQQIVGICGLQQSTHEAEEALSQGLEALNQSLSDTIASDSLSASAVAAEATATAAAFPPPPPTPSYISQMSLALNKLSALENFVLQADHLRHQTVHRLHQLLTTHQAARSLLAIADYFHRLQALSSLWMARPRQD